MYLKMKNCLSHSTTNQSLFAFSTMEGLLTHIFNLGLNGKKS